MKHKIVIEIPPYYIDTLVFMTSGVGSHFEALIKTDSRAPKRLPRVTKTVCVLCNRLFNSVF
jgi:hypothetical protein